MKTKKAENIMIIISGIFTLAILIIMNLLLIPQIEKNTGGIRMFDMNPLGYSFEQARQFVSLLQPADRYVYLFRQLPLDFFYPLCYGCFFILLLKKLCKKKRISFIFPLLLMIFDYGENICSIIMLKTDFTSVTAGIGCVCTVAKSILMYGIILLLIVLLICSIVKHRKMRQ